MGYDTVRFPKDPTDLSSALTVIDSWHDKVLVITREPNPTEGQKSFVQAVNHRLTDTMIRMFGPTFKISKPDTQSFTAAAMTLQKTVHSIAEVGLQTSAEIAQENIIAQQKLLSEINGIDVRLRISGYDIIKLLTINSAFMSGPETSSPLVRAPIEDGAMATAVMLREIMSENPNRLNEIVNDEQVRYDVQFISNKSIACEAPAD